MLDRALCGSKRYYALLTLLILIIGAGVATYAKQLEIGLGITGMNRDVTWGFYIAQFTFLVGVAASAVMLVIPYYLHNYKEYGKITILGEFVAVAACTMCLLFIAVDLGQPQRIFNVLLHPTPNSVLFWDMIVLNGYLGLNIVIGWTTLGADKRGVPAPAWVKPLIYLSIPWAVSIHTVTAFLYAGLPGRGFWLTAVMAPRFLTSAFAAGPALLIILAFVVRKFTNFDPGKKAIQALAKTVTYAIIANFFLLICEVFTVFYSSIPDHKAHFEYLFGLGHYPGGAYVPFMWFSVALTIIAILMLVNPKIRNGEGTLIMACAFVFVATWIDKGLGMISGGFVPNPLHEVHEYIPSAPELLISLAVWAIGALILTVLWKIAVSVREEEAV